LNIVFEPLQKGGSIKDAKKKVEEKVPTVTSPQPTNTDSMWRPYDNSTVDEINEIFRINQVEGFEYMVVGIDEETQERAVVAERDIPFLAYQNMKYSNCVVTQKEYKENPDKFAEFYSASNEDKTKPMVYTLRKDETNTPCSLAPFMNDGFDDDLNSFRFITVQPECHVGPRHRDYEKERQPKVLLVRQTRAIKKGEQIFIGYNGEHWKTLLQKNPNVPDPLKQKVANHYFGGMSIKDMMEKAIHEEVYDQTYYDGKRMLLKEVKDDDDKDGDEYGEQKKKKAKK